MEDPRIAGQELAGRSILIIEDESIVTMLIEDILGDLGCEIAGVSSRFEDAIEKVSSLSFDLAIIDVNLNGRATYPLAEILSRKGIPFVFATGYGTATLPQALHGVPVISKPFNQRDLERVQKVAISNGREV